MKKTPRFPSVRQMIVESALRELCREDVEQQLLDEDWNGSSHEERLRRRHGRTSPFFKKNSFDAVDTEGLNFDYSSPDITRRLTTKELEDLVSNHKQSDQERYYGNEWERKSNLRSLFADNRRFETATNSDLLRIALGDGGREPIEAQKILWKRANDGSESAKRALEIIRKRDPLNLIDSLGDYIGSDDNWLTGY